MVRQCLCKRRSIKMFLRLKALKVIGSKQIMYVYVPDDKKSFAVSLSFSVSCVSVAAAIIFLMIFLLRLRANLGGKCLVVLVSAAKEQEIPLYENMKWPYKSVAYCSPIPCFACVCNHNMTEHQFACRLNHANA